MKNLKIRFKILIPMLLLMLCVAGGNLLQFYGMAQIKGQEEIFAHSIVPKIEGSMQITQKIMSYRANLYGYVMSTTLENAHSYALAMHEAAKEGDATIGKYKQLNINSDEKALFAVIEEAWGLYKQFSYTVIAKKINGFSEEAETMLNSELAESYNKAISSTQNLISFNTASASALDALANERYRINTYLAIGLSLSLFVMGLLIVHTVVNNVAVPVTNITKYMGYLASGKLDKDVPSQDLQDEVGDMARAVQVFKNNMVKAKTLEEEQDMEAMKKEARQQKVDSATRKFEDVMTGIVSFVTTASAELQKSAKLLASNALETTKQSNVANNASQQAANNVQTVASASEELSASINEISSQVARSAQVAHKAVTEARQAGASVGALVEAADKIGEVTKMISDIAEQTNLLALNATIEAARAGDSGKGFAVVASEVKNLANEATKATEEISSQITSIQLISQNSAEAINMICKIIEEMSEISGSISAAIQEQTAATQEISRNVSEAYAGTAEVNQSIESVNRAANDTGSASQQVLSAADELSKQSETLREEFGQFIKSVEAA